MVYVLNLQKLVPDADAATGPRADDFCPSTPSLHCCVSSLSITLCP
jgi:hypothetical protein